jgi:hypothetical protein
MTWQLTNHVFRVTWTKQELPFEAVGWSFPLWEEYQGMTDARNCFNRVSSQDGVKKAELSLNISYENLMENGLRSVSTRHFILASWDHKAKNLEIYSSKQQFWEANRDRYPGIVTTYVD